MNPSKLSIICGLTIEAADFSDDGAGLRFAGGIVLVVYNQYGLEGFSARDASSLAGQAVAEVTEAIGFIAIRFENDWAIRVDMRDEGFTGPEALQLLVPGQPTAIWT